SSTNTLTNKSGNVSMWTNDANYIKNSEETDPVFVASPSHTITYTDINNWNNKSEFDGNYSSLTNAPDIANSTLDKNITLSTGGTMSIKDAVNSYLTIQQSTGLIGMGYNATVPRAQLEIGGTEGLLVRGTVNSGTVRALGAGLRMHWYPRKGTFRVGNAESSYWDDDGSANPKLALYSIAMGYQPRATAVASTAIGAYNQATGDYSLALGSYCQATQSHSIAIGTQAYATGIYSIALGSGANTNGMDGAMVFGDDCYFQTAYSSKDNELTMRFEGGYRLWSSYPDSTAGVYMRHGQSSWSSYCDRNLKTNFRKLDKEDVLKKVQDMPVTEWNYKKFDSIKYIGPMAQDFYAAFHLGGEDSLGINTICMDGVNMAAIQGLIKRTDDLNSEVVNLKSYIEKLEKELNKISLVEQKTKEQEETINLLTRKIEQLTKSSTLKAKNKKKMQKNAYFVKKTVFTE
ncbi:MAG: tail fiber domain-containing protein, partial [Bacteroidota bacterium]